MKELIELPRQAQQDIERMGKIGSYTADCLMGWGVDARLKQEQPHTNEEERLRERGMGAFWKP